MRLFRTRVNGTDEQYVNPLATEDGMPGYAVQWIEIEGPFYDDDDTSGLSAAVRRSAAAARRSQGGPGVSLEGVPGMWRRCGRPRGRRAWLAQEDSVAAASRRRRRQSSKSIRRIPRKTPRGCCKDFMSAAYRRPVDEADVQRFLALFDEQFAKGRGFARSMLSAYTAVLASPRFVFIEEQPGRLDDMALATRLSLFLWNSTPDATLRALADRGELHKPDVLRAADRRLLDDPKVAPLRRCVHRLLARPSQDRRHFAVRRRSTTITSWTTR